jgi:hypothetical protein
MALHRIRNDAPPFDAMGVLAWRAKKPLPKDLIGETIDAPSALPDGMAGSKQWSLPRAKFAMDDGLRFGLRPVDSCFLGRAGARLYRAWSAGVQNHMSGRLRGRLSGTARPLKNSVLWS